ncbi:MAG: HD domain-containing protein [Deltaproteobacteria bacterium]|jgi:tRNA nucleotidyltransferase (CCA-adding enzyme)|nr:HD domain-containing protein [Deltaproteobacteria bacterium]
MSAPSFRDELPRLLAGRFAAAGGRLLAVGGQVRDDRLAALVGEPVRGGNDVDLVAFGLDFGEISRLAAELGPVRTVAHRLIKDRPAKTPALIVFADGLSISASRRLFGGLAAADPRATVEEDALARDFTVNALYWDPLTGDCLDPLGGLDDVRARRLEPCSPVSLTADPARIIRAMGLVSRLGLTAGPKLLTAARGAWPFLSSIPSERLWPEWRKWALSRRPRAGLDFLKESSALQFWPELAALVGSPQHPRFHPEGDVWTHTLLTVEAVGRLSPRPADDSRLTLTLTALLHDVGKPEVTFLREDGMVVTRGHARAGRPLIRRFLKSVAAPTAIVRAVEVLAARHMDLSFRNLASANLRTLARKLAPLCDLEQFWALAAADWNGRSPCPLRYPWTLEEFLSPVGGRKGPAELPLDARRLMAALGLTGGPTVGRLMALIAAAVDDGTVTEADEALALAASALVEAAEPKAAELEAAKLEAEQAKERERAMTLGF